MCHKSPRVTFFIQKYYKMHCGVRLHGQNACYVIFWDIASQHWIYMDRGYCNSFYFYLWLYNYWEYVIECVFAVGGHIILKIWLILKNLKKIIMTQFVDYKHRIWWYNYWIFFNPTNFSTYILVDSVWIHVKYT
jgi:hypothetical protein